MNADTVMLLPAIFELGQLCFTRGVVEKLSFVEVWHAVQRHAVGDWGDVCKEDSLANDEAVKEGFRLLSVYHSNCGQKFWVITEWDRSLTTVLLPEEY